MKSRFLVFICFSFSNQALSHSSLRDSPGLSIKPNLNLSYRSQDEFDTNKTVWQIPGALMGGEAYRSKQGLSIDELFVSFDYQSEQARNLYLKVGTHGGQIEVEQAFFRESLFEHIFFDVGRLSSKLSPFIEEHASASRFTDKALFSDIIWGRQYIDEGLRLSTSFSHLELGIEVWQGQRFPSYCYSGNCTVASSYLHHRLETDSVSNLSGIYFYSGYADERFDDRYEAGHSHGGSQIEAQEYYFSGHIKIFGIFTNQTWSLSETSKLHLASELTQSHSEGKLNDPTKLARLDSKIKGGFISMGLSIKALSFFIREERLQLSNELSGAGAEALADITSLADAHKDPRKSSLSISYEQVLLEWQHERLGLVDQKRWILSYRLDDIFSMDL